MALSTLATLTASKWCQAVFWNRLSIQGKQSIPPSLVLWLILLRLKQRCPRSSSDSISRLQLPMQMLDLGRLRLNVSYKERSNQICSTVAVSTSLHSSLERLFRITASHLGLSRAIRQRKQSQRNEANKVVSSTIHSQLLQRTLDQSRDPTSIWLTSKRSSTIIAYKKASVRPSRTWSQDSHTSRPNNSSAIKARGQASTARQNQMSIQPSRL